MADQTSHSFGAVLEDFEVSEAMEQLCLAKSIGQDGQIYPFQRA